MINIANAEDAAAARACVSEMGVAVRMSCQNFLLAYPKDAVLLLTLRTQSHLSCTTSAYLTCACTTCVDSPG